MDRLTALVLLRWRMDFRTLTWARERSFGLLLMLPGLLLFSALGSFFVFFGVRTVERTDPGTLLPLLSVLATGVGFFWVLSPVLAGVAFSETHDMSRLLHFPIPLPILVASSLVANLAQPMVLAEVPIVLSLSLALTESPAGLLLSLAGVLLSFAFLLASAQVVGLLLHGLSRNRRLQDLALFLGLGVGFLVSLLPILFLSGAVRPLGALRGLLTSDAFALSPFAWGVRAAVHGGRGEMAAFLAWAFFGALGIAAAMGLSSLLIHRIHRGELNLGGTPGAANATRARMLLPGALGALLEKELRAAWRDPALKAAFFMGLAGPLLFLIFLSQTTGSLRSGSGLLMLATFVGVSAFGSNAFGLERRGVALLMSFPLARWRILVGKNLSAVALRLPGLLTVTAAGLLLAPACLPAALTIALAALLISAGADNYASILFPVAVPEPGKNPYGTASGGRGLGAAALGAALFMGALLLASPFVLLGWLPLLFEEPSWWWVSLPLTLAGAVSTYALLVAGAEALLRRREPELLERILGEA